MVESRFSRGKLIYDLPNASKFKIALALSLNEGNSKILSENQLCKLQDGNFRQNAHPSGITEESIAPVYI